MKTKRILNIGLFLITILTLLQCKSAWQTKKLNYAGGFSNGTYGKFGQALKSLQLNTVTVLKTHGSLQNIQYLSNQKAHIGLTQMDILFREYNHSVATRSQVKILLPTFTEEVHIIVKKSIRKFSNLKQKKISIGPAGSGTNLTAKYLIKKLGLANKINTVEISIEKSIEKLKNNSLDGVFIVAGKPVSLLKKIKNSENLHLLSLTNKEMIKLTKGHFYYNKGEIVSGTYSWQKETIDVLTVVSAFIVNSQMGNAMVVAYLKEILNKKRNLSRYHDKWNDFKVKYLRYYLVQKPEYFHNGALEYLKSLEKKTSN